LSWIKKIFTKFQKDDDEFDNIEREKKVFKPAKTEKSQKKDIDAKVLYQYPKGQFRFPLIPDEEAAAEKRHTDKKRPERVQPVSEVKPFFKEQGSLRMKNNGEAKGETSSKQRREKVREIPQNYRREPVREKAQTIKQEPVRETEQGFRNDPVKESVSKFRYEPRKDSGPKFRQPFKPTEIPSPIYAYNRPPRKPLPETKIEEVEYELTRFERQQDIATVESKKNDVNEVALDMNQQDALNNEQNEVSDERPKHDNYIGETFAETPDIDLLSGIEDKEYQYDLETEALNHILGTEPPHHVVKVRDEVETVHKTTIEDEEILHLAEDIQTEADGQTVLQQKEAGVEAKIEAETVAAAKTEAFAPAEAETEAAAKTEAFADSAAEAETGTLAEAEEEAEAEAPTKVSAETDASAKLDVDTEAVAEKPAEPKTRQLPFNVLMLKQDKRKWEDRNVSKYPSFMTEGTKTISVAKSAEQTSGTTPDNSEETTGNGEVLPEQSAPEESAVHPAFKQSAPEESAGHPAFKQSAPEESAGHPAFKQSGPGEQVWKPAYEQQADSVVRGGQTNSVLTRPEPGSQSPIEPEQVPVQSAPGLTNIQSAPLQSASSGSEEKEMYKSIQDVPAAEEYEFPPLDLLSPPVFKAPDPQWLAEQEHMLNETLRNFNVGARVVNMTQGPSVTRFEVQPEPGVKVNKITNLSDDIKLSLAAKDIRIEAPIPGKHTIGIEVPNHSSRPVLLSEILQSSGFLDHESPLAVALGLDIAGTPIVTDLKKMPHGLIAGATGSGKSVCINTMLVSLLYKAHPDDVKLLLIDPKMVELAPYNQIPHLVSPVITDVKAATAALKWAVEEMERRYELFAHTGVRDISRFNELAIKHRRFSDKLPFIVIVIDELADLMMMAPADVEEAICRIAQKARACGIHLIIATQRPSVDVITGLIKANVPTRIAFSVSSQIDSRTIIDISGAEKLLGRGDMLFLENGSSKPFRLQGTFVTDNEIDDIVAFAREQRTPQYLFEQEELLRKAQITEDEDELFYEACEFVVEQGGASTSSVQRRFKIGYNRAARLIEMMEQQGFISEGRGSKPRDVLISAADLESLQETSTFN
jgi:DNA segregation ATPase FtsK/SpoIIIE, S-DNA-T family